MSNSASTIKPSPIALVVCDSIYQEPGGKTALVGLFNSILAHKFPAKHPRLAVFASLTGLRPNSKVRLEIVHSESEQVVVAAEGTFPEDAGPLDVVDLSFVFNNLVFHEEGKYHIRLWGNGHPLLMRSFSVQSPTKK